jgi:hypothetical protein
MSEKAFIILSAEMYNSLLSEQTGILIRSDKDLLNEFISDEIKNKKRIKILVLLNFVLSVTIGVLAMLK